MIYCRYTSTLLFDINIIQYNIITHVRTIQRSYEKGHQKSHQLFAFQVVQNNKCDTSSHNRCLDQSRIVGDQHQTALKPRREVSERWENPGTVWMYP